MADEPTWPAWNPSVTSSWPAISRIVVASDDGAGAGLGQRRDHVEVERARIHLPDAGQHAGEPEVPGDRPLELGHLGRVAEQVELVLRGADRALDAAQRIALDEVGDAVVRDEQLLGRRWRTACRAWSPGPARCGTGPPSPASSNSIARAASRASAATIRSRTSSSESRICSCSTFSVRSREVIPLWMCSCPASAANSSMRALTSWRVTRSRAAMDWPGRPGRRTASYASTTPSGTGTPRSRWAVRTASQSRRSARTFSSGDQIRTSSAEA